MVTAPVVVQNILVEGYECVRRYQRQINARRGIIWKVLERWTAMIQACEREEIHKRDDGGWA